MVERWRGVGIGGIRDFVAWRGGGEDGRKGRGMRMGVCGCLRGSRGRGGGFEGYKGRDPREDEGS